MFHILVVEDDPNARRLMRAVLERAEYTVSAAENGKAALECLDTQHVDLILLDVMMPGMDGFETCRRLKADPVTRHIPVVLVTALDGREDKIRGLDAGADDFVTKPIDDVILFARVKSLVRLNAVRGWEELSLLE